MQVLHDCKISNALDWVELRRRKIQPSEVREISVNLEIRQNFAALCLPVSVIMELGLGLSGVISTIENGTRQKKNLYGPALIKTHNKSIQLNVMESPGENTYILGYQPLMELDLHRKGLEESSEDVLAEASAAY